MSVGGEEVVLSGEELDASPEAFFFGFVVVEEYTYGAVVAVVPDFVPVLAVAFWGFSSPFEAEGLSGLWVCTYAVHWRKLCKYSSYSSTFRGGVSKPANCKDYVKFLFLLLKQKKYVILCTYDMVGEFPSLRTGHATWVGRSFEARRSFEAMLPPKSPDLALGTFPRRSGGLFFSFDVDTDFSTVLPCWHERKRTNTR